MSDRHEGTSRALDVTREANLALWNALLNVEGFILAVFGASAVFGSLAARDLALFIILLSLISGVLLVQNFVSTRNFYRSLGQRDRAEIEALSPEAFQERLRRDTDVSKRKYVWRNRRELWAILLLAVQAISIVALVWFTRIDG
jgi:hypothetical protein